MAKANEIEEFKQFLRERPELIHAVDEVLIEDGGDIEVYIPKPSDYEIPAFELSDDMKARMQVKLALMHGQRLDELISLAKHRFFEDWVGDREPAQPDIDRMYPFFESVVRKKNSAMDGERMRKRVDGLLADWKQRQRFPGPDRTRKLQWWNAGGRRGGFGQGDHKLIGEVGRQLREWMIAEFGAEKRDDEGELKSFGAALQIDKKTSHAKASLIRW